MPSKTYYKADIFHLLSQMISVFLLFLVTLLLSIFFISPVQAKGYNKKVKTNSSPVFPLPGEWPSPGRDGTLQNRTPLKGKITNPEIIWEKFTGIIESQFIVRPDERNSTVAFPCSKLTFEPDEINKAKWGKMAESGMIAGKMQPIETSTRTIGRDVDLTYADVLPNVPGLEKIDFSTINKKVNGWHRGRRTGRLWAWKNGEWELQWKLKNDWGSSEWNVSPKVGDFDGDGNLEIAYLRWYKIIILDAVTGKEKETLTFRPTDCKQGRNYGYFGIHDLNNDGLLEFVIQADFPKHVDVLGYKNGNLQLLWQRNIEYDIITQRKLHVVNPNPVVDVDGDGSKEVIVMTYNDDWANQWKVTIHDGISGVIKEQLKGEYLWGIVDLDGDGVCELLTQDMPMGSQPTSYGTLRVQSFKHGTLKRIWALDNASWAMWEHALPVNASWTHGATPDRRDVLYKIIDGKANVVFKTPGRNGQDVVLTIATWEANTFNVKTKINGPRLEAIGLDDKLNLLLKTYCAENTRSEINVLGGHCKILASYKKAYGKTLPLVAWEQKTKQPVIIVQSHPEQIVAFNPPEKNKPVKELWRTYGWGQLLTQGSVIADLNGDGQRQHIYATCSPSGCARIMVTDLAGVEIWHHDFPTIRGTRIRQNTDGMSDLISWNVGHFTDRHRLDIIVAARRSVHGNEEVYVLSGRDGRGIWFRDRQDSVHYHRGIGGAPFGIGDYDGDGLDEILNVAWNHLHVIEGDTGDNLIFINAAKDGQVDGCPPRRRTKCFTLIGDFENNGKICFANKLGVIRPSGEFVWVDKKVSNGQISGRSSPVCGDFDNDGKEELVMFFRNEGIKFIDSATGKLKWNIPEVKGIGQTAVSDIDSDGREELIIASGKKILCVGTDRMGKIGEVEWEYEMPVNIVSSPVIADVDGSGMGAILVIGKNGYLYCIQ